MSAETQKLELISWIADLEDPEELKRVYEQFKKNQNPGTHHRKIAASQPVDASDALQSLEKITDEYAKVEEPDLNPEQIFANRLISYERKIDFN